MKKQNIHKEDCQKARFRYFIHREPIKLRSCTSGEVLGLMKSTSNHIGLKSNLRNQYDVKYKGNKELSYVMLNETTIYNIKHLLQLFAGVRTRDINNKRKPTQRGKFYHSFDAEKSKMNMDELSWNDVMNYKDLLMEYKKYRRSRNDKKKVIGIIYVFLKLILCLNGRDEYLMYLTCPFKKNRMMIIPITVIVLTAHIVGVCLVMKLIPNQNCSDDSI